MQNIFERNISIGYSSTGADDDWEWANFYANKVYITVQDEEIRGEVKMASGEIRVRYKKRRKVVLEIPFFDKFNGFYNQENPNYETFEIVINSPFLRFKWLSNDTTNKEWKYTYPDLPYVINYKPYNMYPIMPKKYTIDVFLKEKETIFLNNHYEKQIIKLTLMEKKNWYN